MENWGCDRFLGLKNCCWPPEIIFLMIDLTIRDPLDYWVFAWASPHLQQIAEGFSHVFTNNLCSPWDKDMVMGQELRPFWRMYPDFHLYNAQRMGVSENGAYHPNAFPKALVFGQTQIWYRCLNMPPISPKKSPLDTHPPHMALLTRSPTTPGPNTHPLRPRAPAPCCAAPGSGWFHAHHYCAMVTGGHRRNEPLKSLTSTEKNPNQILLWYQIVRKSKYTYIHRVFIYLSFYNIYHIYIYTYKISSSYHFLPKLMLQGP